MQSPFIAYDPIYALQLPEGHRFPMLKYELIPGQLLYEGSIAESDIFPPQAMAEEVILHTHDADYWRRMKNLQLSEREMRAIGLPLSNQLVQRCITIAQGTLDCARKALKGQVALNVAGGTHHAFAGRGEGFCLLNDFAIAANWLLHTGEAKKLLIADLDVHQGNGTAALLQNEQRVFTFSMHGQHNYPFRKEQSDLDIGLNDGTGGSEYLGILKDTLPRLLDEQQPDAVFYLAGADVLSTDKYGKLQLSREDCAARDRFVFEQCRQRGLGVAVSMGGGHSPDIRDIVDAHCNTFRMAMEVFTS